MNPLKSPAFEQILGNPVPQQDSHLGKQWFHKELSRHSAEDMLKRVRMDGAFLIRPSEQKPQSPQQKNYSISFRYFSIRMCVCMYGMTHSPPPHRAEGRVRHCRIQVENAQYMIGSATFDSLTELVQYYESNPLYRRMKLKYAINDEVLKSIGEVSGCGHPKSNDKLILSLTLTHSFSRSPQDPDENSIYYHPVYFTFNDDKQKPVAVRALYDYTQRRADELSFGKGAIITNVEKHEGGWWRGDYGRKKKKWFPANYVEEIDTADPQTEAEKQLGNLQQGAIDIAGKIKVELMEVE